MPIFPGGVGGYSWEFLVGVCCPVLQILTLFQTKKCHIFPYLFSDQTSKIHTHFQTWPLGRNYVIITQIRVPTNAFRIHIFLYRTYSFRIEMIACLYTPLVPSKTIPNFRQKWAKCIPVFRPKRPKHHTLWDSTYLYGLCNREPPPPPRFPLLLFYTIFFITRKI